MENGNHASLGPPTCVLKVNLQCCKACPRAVKKQLTKIKGVTESDIHIDIEEGLVTVSGVADASILIKAIKKAGRKAVVVTDNSNMDVHAPHFSSGHGGAAGSIVPIHSFDDHPYNYCQPHPPVPEPSTYPGELWLGGDEPYGNNPDHTSNDSYMDVHAPHFSNGHGAAGSIAPIHWFDHPYSYHQPHPQVPGPSTYPGELRLGGDEPVGNNTDHTSNDLNVNGCTIT